MRATSLQNKAYIAPVVAAVGLSVVGAGLVSDGVVKADTTSVTDTINVTVQPSCTFNSVIDKTYIGSAANGVEVDNFNDSGEHEFNLFCNDHSGFTVSATPHNLTATGITDVFSYTDNYLATGTDSLWTAEISSEDITVVPTVPVTDGTIITSLTNTPAAGISFKATYRAYVGSATPAGTYTGTIEYTLASAGSSNSGSNSQQNANQDSNNSGNEEPGGANSGTSGGSGTPDAQEQGGEQSDPEPGNSEPSNSPANTNKTSNTPSLAMTPSNNYSTNNTYNTYNTTSYPGASTSLPIDTSALASTTSGEDSGNSSNTDSNYEKPLGVVNTTKSSDKDSGGIDPAPIAVAGALATIGLAGVALMKNGSKEEEKK